MTTLLPRIYRDCRKLLVLTEDMVRRFSRDPNTPWAPTCVSQPCCSMRLRHALVQQVACLRNQWPHAVCSVVCKKATNPALCPAAKT